MAKVMVVGGAGYIGSHVAKALHLSGHEVLVYDDLSTGFRVLAKYGTFVLGSILDRQKLEDTLKNFQPDAVMHFAARAAVGESVQNPALYYQVNVTGSFELFDGLRRICPKAKVIFSSTCAVYGESKKGLTEETPLQPVNPYGRTKKMIEDLLADYSRAYGLQYISLRYFNAAGADLAGEIGEMHDPETHLIPRLLHQVHGNSKEEVQIFGDDYETPDGTCVRDYIHVEDLARAHILAMDYLLKGGTSDIFNLGTSVGASVLEVLRLVEKVTGQKVPLKVGPRRAGDPAFLVSGSEKIKKILHWSPQHDLESIVKSAWHWTSKVGKP